MSNAKSSNSALSLKLYVAASDFLERHLSDSRRFLDLAFSLQESVTDKSQFLEIPTTVHNALMSIDQSVFFDYLERCDCPSWLGTWAAKEGNKDHQIAYLFSPNTTEELSIEERVTRRPREVRELFWYTRSPFVMGSLLNYDDDSYLVWARDIGCDVQIRQPSVQFTNVNEYVGPVRSQILDWFEKSYDPIIDSLWKQYVPEKGESTVLQGELARCIMRLQGEYWRNAMGNMGNGNYEAMVDLIKKTISSDKSFSKLVRKVVAVDAAIVKGADYSRIRDYSLLAASDVEISLYRLQNVVAAWCKNHPEPIPFNP